MRKWFRRISVFLGVFVACGLQAPPLIGAPLESAVRELEQKVEQNIERKLHPQPVPHLEPLERPSGYTEARPGEDIKLNDNTGKVPTKDQVKTQEDIGRTTHKCVEQFLNRSDRENCERE